MADDLPDAPWVIKTNQSQDLPDAPWATKPPMSWGEVGSQAISNLGPSAGNFVRNTIQPIIHPIETAKTLGNVGLGVLEKIQDQYPGTGTPLSRGHEQYADALGQMYSDRYGGLENIKHTLATDPVGVLGDVSAVTGLGEATLPGRIGQAAGAVSRLTNPAELAVRGTGAVARKMFPAARADADTLAAAGVQMTPGQLAGGVGKWVEDAATSLPGVGYAINTARTRSIESFNKAIANKTLGNLTWLPSQKQLAKGTAAGHDTIDEVATKLGAAYDRELPKITWTGTQNFENDLNAIRQKYSALGSASGQTRTVPGPAGTPPITVNSVPHLEANLDRLIGPNGLPLTPMTGRSVKNIESELTALQKSYSGSSMSSERELGRAYGEVLTALRDDIARQAPKGVATRLQKINNGWAMYARMREAAARRATSGGLFTPSDLLQAIKSGDKSAGKGTFAKGDALLQNFTETGQRVLPSTIPDSGTGARRALWDLIGTGIGAGAAVGSGTVFPALIGAGVASAPYTPMGMRAVNAARGKYGTVPRAISPYAPAAAQVGAAGRTIPHIVVGPNNNPYAP